MEEEVEIEEVGKMVIMVEIVEEKMDLRQQGVAVLMRGVCSTIALASLDVDRPL